MRHTSRSINTRTGPIRWTLAVLGTAVAVVGLTAAPAAAAVPGPAGTRPAPAARHQGRAATGSTALGSSLQATVYPTPPLPTPEQAAYLKDMGEDEPNVGRPTTRHPSPALNAALTAPGGIQPLATSILRDSTIPTSGLSGGSTNASYTQEPSTDANGSNIFQTGNWYASRSTDNGATWSALDPFSIFGTGFCCDQVTQYDPVTGRQFWLLQYCAPAPASCGAAGNHLVLANASASGSGAFTNWCWYTITPSWYGLPDATTALDYNDLTISNSYVYIASNYFPSAGGSGAALVRLPAASMASCGGFSFNYLTRTDNFTFKLVPGSTDTLYWGSNWGQTNGSSFRLFAWAENSTSYSWWDATVAAFTFYTRNSGQNCASADGVVTNWCQFADSRVLGAYRAAGVLGFSFNAKQDASHPFPFTRIVWFNESTKAYIGAGDVWGSWGAIQFLSLAPNSAGRAGGVYAWGGGTGTTHYYPGTAAYSTGASTIEDNSNFFLWGDGNTCQFGGLWRWGDYLTSRTYKANPATWIATGYAIKGGNCGATGTYATPHNINFSG